MIATASLLQEGDNSIPRSNKQTFWQQLGMNQAPFAEALQYAMYYPVPVWQTHIQTLQQMSSKKQRLMILTAKTGSGKSMLLAQFIAQTDESYIHKINASSQTRINELLESIRKGFQLPLSNAQATWQQQLNRDLLAIAERHQAHLLVIDNAHLLPAESLAMIVNLAYAQHQTHICLHIILSGEPLLRERLINLPELQEKHIEPDLIELQPLTVEETKIYIKTRLTKAGFNREFPFTDEQINQLHQFSQGMPSLLNKATQNMLIDIITHQPKQASSTNSDLSTGARPIRKTTQPQEATSNNFIGSHKLKILSIILLVAVIIWLWMQGVHHFKPIKTPITITTQSIEPTTTIPTTTQPQAAIATVTPKQQPPILAVTAPVIPMHTVSNQFNHKPQQPDIPQAAIATVAPKQQPPKLAVTIPVTPMHTVSSQFNHKPQQPDIPQSTSIASIPPTMNKIPQIPMTNTIKVTATHQNPPQTAAIIPVEPTPTNVAETKPVIKNQTSEQQLLRMTGYSLQLFGVHNVNSLKQFLASHRLNQPVNFYHTRFQGKSWFVLLYGHYATYQEAKTALSGLAKNLPTLKPWIRPLTSVHKAIRDQTIG